MADAPASSHGRLAGPLSRLGRFIVRHPWYPIIFWIGVLVVSLPFLSLLGASTTNSAATISPGAPSQVAAQQLAEQFPNQSGGSESIVLLVGANITGPTGQTSVLAVSNALATNSSLKHIDSVDSLYSAYQGYLAGETFLALNFLAPALDSSPPLPVAVNETASLLYGPPAGFVTTWQALNAAHPGTNASVWNAPAYTATLALLGNNSSLIRVLNAFYAGATAEAGGFNGTLNCASDPASVVACSNIAVTTQVGTIVPGLLPPGSAQGIAYAALGTLGVENYSSASSQRFTGATYLAGVSGLPAPWLAEVWDEFPTGSATEAQVTNWTQSVVVEGSVSTYPLPVPPRMLAQFLSPSNGATIIYVSFDVSDDYTDSAGSQPVFSDVTQINSIVPSVLHTTDPTGSIAFYQTGPAPLDQAESSVLGSSVALVLPLTFVVLLIITVLYFRAPLAPLATFTGLGIALVLGLAGVVLVGHLVTKVDVTSLELLSVFVLGVGSDYSIFLLARYREELRRGVPHPEAVVAAVGWAGQSVLVSGIAAVLAMLALAFSGVALLSQWGLVLSLAVLITLLVALTWVPAMITLVGPRVFWPYAGGKPADIAAAAAASSSTPPSTYFYRTGRRTQRRPGTIIAVILVASVPLVYIALNVPLSYDFYQQLPSGQGATDGLAQLDKYFGPGFAFPTLLLVTFASPLMVGNTTNATQFADLSALTSLVEGQSGVASVASPVGPFGATLPQWVGFATLPPGTQAQLRGLYVSYVGINNRTVLLTVTSTSPGLSGDAVALLQDLKSALHGFQSTHPSVTEVAFGGGASTTHDLQQQTSMATERLVLAVSIALIIVLFVVLRSFILPFLAVATIGLSIGWAWGTTGVVLYAGLGVPLFYFAPTILFILILGLGIDYNIFLLTRVREERLRGRPNSEAVVEAVGRTGGIITAAAIILASAFGVLLAGSFLLLQVIGFAVAVAILLDAMIVRTYLVPSILQLLGDRAWAFFRRKPAPALGPASGEPAISPSSGSPEPTGSGTVPGPD